MNDKLCEAIKKVIDLYGLNVLKTNKLANVLLDYGAFDVHDQEMPIKKEIISSLILSGYGEKLIRWKKKSRGWKSKHDGFINNFKRKNSFDESIVDEIADAFVNGIGLVAVAIPPKKKKNLKEAIFGKKINLKSKDREAILAVCVFESLVFFISVFIGLGDGSGIILPFLIMATHPFVMMAISGTKDTHFKTTPGMGVGCAGIIGEIITILIPCIIVFADTEMAGGIAVLLLFILFLSYIIGRFGTNTQSRLFGYTLSIISLLLIIVMSIPPIVMQRYIQEHKKSCEETLVLRNEHLQQDISLGFMGVHLGDFYPDVIQKLKSDTNVVSRIKLDKEPYGYLDIIDYDDYLQRCYVQARHVKLDFDKELQYDVSFNNHIDRLYILFFQDTVRHIQFNGEDDELYVEKYGLPEYYYKVPPEAFFTLNDRFPFFKKRYNSKRFYSLEERPNCIAQWSFANGVIRVNDYSVQYISNDVFDTIATRNERANREAEQLRLEQEEKARQMELEKAKQEKEEADKKAQELKQREEERKRAIEKI